MRRESWKAATRRGRPRHRKRRSREPGSPVTFECETFRKSTRFISAIAFSCSLFSGCAGRNPVSNRRLPPPSQPAPTPSETVETAKRSTDIDAARAPAKPTPKAAPKKAKTAAAAVPQGYTEEGNASWYGEPFNGRRASNGEVYDMHKMTAAHRTLPFDTMVRVTNLNNGKSATVRITDRGPFVDNRIIDLSLAAAREIDLVGPGVVPVRVEV